MAKFRSIALVSATIFACACSGPDDQTGLSEEDLGNIRYGVDYSWARPSPAGLHAAGYTFVCRYLSYDTSGKNLSHAEATALINAGLDIVSNWEQSATDALAGYGRGVQDARSAQQQALANGAPATRPIYFSVDFDATPGDQAAINSYFDGVASVIGRGRTGAYGGYYVIKRLFDAGKISWGWQTYAWSGGLWEPRAHLRQIQNGIAGGQLDKDEAVAADFGQWGHSTPAPPPAAPLATSAVARNRDGRLEVFSRGTNGALYHKWQETPGGAWSGWSSLGGVLITDPAVAANHDGRLEVFGVGTNHAMYHQWQTTAGGAWSGWYTLGGGFTSAPVVIANADGRLEVFGRGTNNALYHAWQKAGGWSGWASLGGTITSRPAVAINRDGRLEVFVRGGNEAMYHAWQATPGGAWSGWSGLGGAFTSDPAVAENADGRLELFGRGTNQALYHAWQGSAGWSGWADLGGKITSDVAAMRNADGRLEVFARGTDDAFYHIWQGQGSWSGWHSMGGGFTSNPSAGINADGRLEVFGRGNNHSLYHDWQSVPSGGWAGGWADLGGAIE